MTYNHCLYPLPSLERFGTPSRSLDLSKDLRRKISEQRLKPQRNWTKTRLWPAPHEYIYSDKELVTGLNMPTKAERAIASEAQWQIYREKVKHERTAAKEVCERMTIKEGWEILQSHLHADQYSVEAMSEADWDIYLHAKDLIDQLIKLY